MSNDFADPGRENTVSDVSADARVQVVDRGKRRWVPFSLGGVSDPTARAKADAAQNAADAAGAQASAVGSALGSYATTASVNSALAGLPGVIAQIAGLSPTDLAALRDLLGITGGTTPPVSGPPGAPAIATANVLDTTVLVGVVAASSGEAVNHYQAQRQVGGTGSYADTGSALPPTASSFVVARPAAGAAADNVRLVAVGDTGLTAASNVLSIPAQIGTGASALLLEDGSTLLLEDGSRLLLEA